MGGTKSQKGAARGSDLDRGEGDYSMLAPVGVRTRRCRLARKIRENPNPCPLKDIEGSVVQGIQVVSEERSALRIVGRPPSLRVHSPVG